MQPTPLILRILRILEGCVGTFHSGPLKDVVYALYNSPPRFYHTIDHVAAMFRYADQLEWQLLPAEELAIIFHDCVYVPGYERNELRSAQVMQALMGASLTGDHWSVLGEAFAIIEDTSLFLDPENAQTRSHRVMDLDLLSLGEPDDEKWQIDRYNIEKELGCTPADTAAFFELLLKRDKLFFTPGLGAWEKRAREKMQAYIGEHGGSNAPQ